MKKWRPQIVIMSCVYATCIGTKKTVRSNRDVWWKHKGRRNYLCITDCERKTNLPWNANIDSQFFITLPFATSTTDLLSVVVGTRMSHRLTYWVFSFKGKWCKEWRFFNKISLTGWRGSFPCTLQCKTEYAGIVEDNKNLYSSHWCFKRREISARWQRQMFLMRFQGYCHVKIARQWK